MDAAWAGKRLSVVLAGIVGVLSIVTGVANIAYGDVAVIGPLQPYVPHWVRTAAGFTGALTGFMMLVGAIALRDGYRAGWYLTAVLLPVTAVQGLIQSSPLSLPLILSSLLAVPVLLANYRRFDEPLKLTPTQIAAGLALLGVQVYGTVGAYALREEFDGVRTLLDAFYFTIVTASTVGYGDVTARTQVARLFAMSVLILGTASFAVALGALIAPLIEARFAAALGRARGRELELLEGHALVLGYGDLTGPIVSELAGRREFVVLDENAERVAELDERGHLAMHADPADEAALDRAKIDDAAVAIVATDSDADDAFTVLTVRQLRPDLRIVAAATSTENVAKLERAGADVVVSPPTIGSRLLVGTGIHGAEATGSGD